MVNAERKRNVMKCFQPVYGTLSNHYGKLFVPSMQSERAEHCKYWIDEISNSDLIPESLPLVAEKIKASSEFSSRPPNPSQFIAFAKKIQQPAEEKGEVSEIEKVFYVIFNNMRERYRYLWDKNNENENSPTYRFWLDEIKLSDVSLEVLKETFEVIPRIPFYVTYPPAINDVLLMFKIIGAEKTIPLPHEAQTIALSRDENVHPIIRYARYEMDIRKIEKYELNKKFVSFYSNAAMEYLSGNLDLSKFEGKIIEDNDSDYLKPEDLAKNLDDLLKKL